MTLRILSVMEALLYLRFASLYVKRLSHSSNWILRLLTEHVNTTDK